VLQWECAPLPEINVHETVAETAGALLAERTGRRRAWGSEGAGGARSERGAGECGVRLALAAADPAPLVPPLCRRSPRSFPLSVCLQRLLTSLCRACSLSALRSISLPPSHPHLPLRSMASSEGFRSARQ